MHVLCFTSAVPLCSFIARMAPCAPSPSQCTSMYPSLVTPATSHLSNLQTPHHFYPSSLTKLLMYGPGLLSHLSTAVDSSSMGAQGTSSSPTQTLSPTKPASVHMDTLTEWTVASLKNVIISSKSCQLVGLGPNPAHRQCSIWPAQCFEQTDINCHYVKVGNFTLKSTSPAFH